MNKVNDKLFSIFFLVFVLWLNYIWLKTIFLFGFRSTYYINNCISDNFCDYDNLNTSFCFWIEKQCIDEYPSGPQFIFSTVAFVFFNLCWVCTFCCTEINNEQPNIQMANIVAEQPQTVV